MNKETLQEYNGKLEENNVSLANVLTTINNLPETSSGGSSNIYSTEERRVGTWIDGKPLYRKVVDLGSGDISEAQIQTGIINMDSVIRIECCIKNTGYGGWRTIPFLYVTGTTIGSGAWAGGFWLNGEGSIIEFEMGKTLGTIIKGYATIEYTKTTD